jgi:hypothetical protein
MPTAATTADDSPRGMIKAERSGRLPTKRSVQAVPLCGSILLRQQLRRLISWGLLCRIHLDELCCYRTGPAIPQRKFGVQMCGACSVRLI